MREMEAKISKMEEGPAPIVQWVEDGVVTKGERKQKILTFRCIGC